MAVIRWLRHVLYAVLAVWLARAILRLGESDQWTDP